MPPPESGRSWFQCEYPGCKARYRRREHLNRHSAHHNQRDTLACPYCESVLSRSDLLRRHIRTHHPLEQLPSSRASRACSSCRVRKERCDGGLPCSACQHRGVLCVPAEDKSTREQQNVDDGSEFCSLLDPSLPQTLSAAFAIDGLNPAGSTTDTPRWIAHDYVDIYFETFHPVWPFLHRSTFDLTREPCVLVQSVVMIGLWVKGGQEARDASIQLHNRLCSAMHAQRNHWCISDSEPCQNTSCSWPMATYQSVLLNIILSLLIGREEASVDLSLRCRLPRETYELLVALVQTCRRWDMFSYPKMLGRHDSEAPLALVWVDIEETKRFGLALYKVCRLSTCSDSTGERTRSDRSELLTLADLSFCLPDSDEAWNSSSSTGSQALENSASSGALRDNGNPKNWISESSSLFYDAQVDFDWI